MTKNKKSSMREGQDKFARLMRLDQLLRTSEGRTLNEIRTDPQIDNISERLLRDNLKEMEEKYGAIYEPNLYRGRERLWRDKNTDFSIMQQTSKDMEIIRHCLDNLNLFKGDPRYDLLRFYLMGLEKGTSESGLSFMSFDNNNEAMGLENMEPILDAITRRYPLKMIYKPFNKEELVMRVMHQIQLVAAKRIIVRQNEELKRTINNRDKMYSVIAHDLRSPMASIRMVLNLAVNMVTPDVVGEEIFSLLDKANRESEDVHDLLDNLLKWTKSQTGRLNVVYQKVDLDDVVPGVVDIFRMIAEMKKINLQYLPAEEKLTVHADNDMIKTVIRNFLSNAIKFTPEGKGIEVYYKHEGDFARICVRDHGVGIAADRVDSIFHTGETTYGTGGEEGSGLGLQLCQDFARKNGGDAYVESTEGEGSIFSFTIPLEKQDTEAQSITDDR